MAQSGLVIGIVLLIVVTVVGLLLGAKAVRGIAQFREEHHENFLGRNRA